MFGALRLRWLIGLLPRTISYASSEKVPFLYKLILLLPVLWFFTPVARLTNLVPIIGLLDEFTVILLAMALFTSLVGRYLKRKEVRQEGPSRSKPLEIIEGEYYVAEQPKSKASKQ